MHLFQPVWRKNLELIRYSRIANTFFIVIVVLVTYSRYIDPFYNSLTIKHKEKDQQNCSKSN